MKPRKRVTIARAAAARTPKRAIARSRQPGLRAGAPAPGRQGDSPCDRVEPPQPVPAPVDLSVDLAPDRPGALVLRNPVLVASGTFGYGIEYGEVVDVDRLGAICCKGTTLKPRIGNAPPTGHRDARWDAQLDRAPEPGRGRGAGAVRAALGRPGTCP